MPAHRRQKQERVIEAVRRSLEGDAAIAFVRRSGFALTQAGIARHLRSMGGRRRVQELLESGNTNAEALEICFPGEDFSEFHRQAPEQGDLFGEPVEVALRPEYGSRKMTIEIPEDSYEALRIAARIEGKSRNDLIAEILRTALSRIPPRPGE